MITICHPITSQGYYQCPTPVTTAPPSITHQASPCWYGIHMGVIPLVIPKGLKLRAHRTAVATVGTTAPRVTTVPNTLSLVSTEPSARTGMAPDQGRSFTPRAVAAGLAVGLVIWYVLPNRGTEFRGSPEGKRNSDICHRRESFTPRPRGTSSWVIADPKFWPAFQTCTLASRRAGSAP